MSRWAYLAVLLVVLASVGFGLDWQPATLSPMPTPKSPVPAASLPKAPAPAAALAPEPQQPPVSVPTSEPTTGTGRARPTSPSGATAGVAPNCNVQACAAAYRSFVAADCSYQPINGPRRRCEKK